MTKIYFIDIMQLSSKNEERGGEIAEKNLHKKCSGSYWPLFAAILFNELLFSSGQIPVDPATGEVVQGDITAQAEQVMKNVGAVLAEAGTDFEAVIKTTCFLSDMGDFCRI